MGEQAPDGWQDHEALERRPDGTVWARKVEGGNARVYDRYNDRRGDRYLVGSTFIKSKTWVDADAVEHPATYINHEKSTDMDYSYGGEEWEGPYPGDPYRYTGPEAYASFDEYMAAEHPDHVRSKR